MHTYPYRYKKIDFGQVLNPVILLPVKSSWGWQNLWFLVDSGADTTILPLALAQKLGLSYLKSSTRLYGIGSQSLPAYPGEIVLNLGNLEIKARSYFVSTKDSTILLGRLDIFDKFSVTFDRQAQGVKFT